MADEYKSLREDYIAEFQKYKEGSLQDAVDYAEKQIDKIKAKKKKKKTESQPRIQQKSKGGAMKKPEMMYGGMANNKKHMYSAGGSVKDNPGLKALAKQRPDVVAKMMKG
jgi:Fic family protein